LGFKLNREAEAYPYKHFTLKKCQTNSKDSNPICLPKSVPLAKGHSNIARNGLRFGMRSNTVVKSARNLSSQLDQIIFLSPKLNDYTANRFFVPQDNIKIKATSSRVESKI
jgi:hypothetical protein